MLGQAFDDVLIAAQTGAGWAFTRLYEDLAGVVTGYLRRQGAQEPAHVVGAAEGERRQVAHEAHRTALLHELRRARPRRA